MKDYYQKRAPIYDHVYAYPERQADLRYLENYIPKQLANKDVLEVAAGTGYWTQFIASTATSVLATDVTKEALDQVKQRLNTDNVTNQVVDAYSLDTLDQTFTAGFSGLWVSHVPKHRLREFLMQFNRQLEPGSTVILLDNSIRQCERLPITHTDEKGNTYQDRTLPNGETHQVLKNFPNESALLNNLSGLADECYYQELDHFWLLQYKAKQGEINQFPEKCDDSDMSSL